MKKFFTFFLLLIPILSFAQTSTFKNQDGATVSYTKLSILKLDLLTHIQVQYGLVSMTKDGEELGYAIFVNSNYGNPTVSEDKKILFRLDNQEVITCPALRAYNEKDRFEAQNANSNVANQKYLQAYYKITEEDLDKITSATIIKMRVEFDQLNLDLDDKKCKPITKTIASTYDALKKAPAVSDEF